LRPGFGQTIPGRTSLSAKGEKGEDSMSEVIVASANDDSQEEKVGINGRRGLRGTDGNRLRSTN